MGATGDQFLLACLVPQPDATLAEIGQAQVAAGGPSLQHTAVWEAVERLGWGRKKSVRAAECVIKLRRFLYNLIRKKMLLVSCS